MAKTQSDQVHEAPAETPANPDAKPTTGKKFLLLWFVIPILVMIVLGLVMRD